MKPRFDVIVLGGSLGGVAAALAAGRLGAETLLILPGNWIGGQLSAQGVGTPDENAWVEAGGCTLSYRTLRERIRDHYRSSYRLSAIGRAQAHFNPGSCWVSRISVEPLVAHYLLEEELRRHPSVTVWRQCRVVSATVTHNRIRSLIVATSEGPWQVLSAGMVLDATDFGDLLPVVGAEHVLGAESRHETGEPDAPAEPRPDWIQPITVPFAVELRPRGEVHTIPRPPAYEHWRRVQNYHVLDGAMRGMFTKFGWWDYRRVICAANFDDPAFPYDVSMINTGSNDFRGGSVPCDDPPSQARLLRQAREASLGYLYWLQTECPREDEPGAAGYPELRLRADWFGTEDGLAPVPYVRESRRIRALTTVFEQDLVARDAAGFPHQQGIRAAFRRDSIGIGHYWLDIHAGASDEPGLFLETRPYQIPLGALIPVRILNLVAASKNIGVTHLANGAFRLHPVEWNIGEAAGHLAAFCVARASQQLVPRDVLERESLLQAFQEELLDMGVPLYWWGDLVPATPVWRAAQWLAQRRVWPEEPDVNFRPAESVPHNFPLRGPPSTTRGDLALTLYNERNPLRRADATGG